jgi:hypothetical protein
MTDGEQKTLACGCVVNAYRDFLGRGVGMVVTRAAQCERPEHAPGQVVLLPGRENARPE